MHRPSADDEAVTEQRPDPMPGVEEPGADVDDTATPGPAPASSDPPVAAPGGPQRRARRGGASRALTAARSLWIIVRERAR
jgi:hypothetical protein